MGIKQDFLTTQTGNEKHGLCPGVLKTFPSLWRFLLTSQGSTSDSDNGSGGGKAHTGHESGKPPVVCIDPTPPMLIPEVLGLIQPRLECCAVNSLIWPQSGTSLSLSSDQVPVLALKGFKML